MASKPDPDWRYWSDGRGMQQLLVDETVPSRVGCNTERLGAVWESAHVCYKLTRQCPASRHGHRRRNTHGACYCGHSYVFAKHLAKRLMRGTSDRPQNSLPRELFEANFAPMLS
jgi:hypothetical protein